MVMTSEFRSDPRLLQPYSSFDIRIGCGSTRLDLTVRCGPDRTLRIDLGGEPGDVAGLETDALTVVGAENGEAFGIIKETDRLTTVVPKGTYQVHVLVGTRTYEVDVSS